MGEGGSKREMVDGCMHNMAISMCVAGTESKAEPSRGVACQGVARAGQDPRQDPHPKGRKDVEC